MKQRRLKSNRSKSKRKDIVNIELDTKCSCSLLTLNSDASIQFTRRYLQCQSSMPIRILRLFIETILPYSPMIKVSMFDLNDRLLKDSDRLYSLKHTSSSSNYIPIRFTLINTVTSLANCSCLSSLLMESDSSSVPTIIQQDAIDQILSTCSITQQISTLPSCLLSSSPPSNLSYTSIGIINVLKPSSFQIDSDLDEATMNRITSQFGEICTPLAESKQYRNVPEYSLDIPLDLSMKKRSLSSLDSLSLQTKWIKT